MVDFSLLVDFHEDGERQGPGSTDDTLRALNLTGLNLNSALRIADIGCGTGAHTLTLARHTRGKITALDLFPEFLEKLNNQALAVGFNERIQTVRGSMDNLSFEKESLDLIWSEGAIYNMGFEKGVKYWHQFLKPGGCLAVSEITWITGSRPAEIEEFWQKDYPEIGMAGEKIRILEENGYSLRAYFILSPESWLKQYYEPMEQRFEQFLERHAHSEAARAIVEENQSEIELYKRFQEYYSYGFYVARKDGPGKS